jgi:hypothetical protein
MGQKMSNKEPPELYRLPNGNWSRPVTKEECDAMFRKFYSFVVPTVHEMAKKEGETK